MKRKKAFAIGSAAVVLAAAAVLFGLWVAGIQTLGTTIDIRPCDAASLQEHMDYYRSVENGSVSVLLNIFSTMKIRSLLTTRPITAMSISVPM